MNRTSDFQSRASEIFNQFLEHDRTAQFSEEAYREKAAAESIAPVELTPAQQLLRPLYGKGDPEPPSIGDHPEFEHLKDTTEVEFSPITTLFVDLEGSTKLGLVYDLTDAFRIKNALIQSAIDIVKSFDGHVHRIMGDAVMAYFGQKGSPAENGAIDGLNCAAVLMEFVDRIVRPKMEEEGYNDPFGIRIGLDFGAKDDVLWSSYGIGRMSEVTATSYYVDVAAKLEQSAGRNEVLIGQSLKQHLDFPDCLLEVPTSTRDGEKTPDYYVRPNYTGENGSPVNYRKYKFLWEKYLEWGPLQMIPNFRFSGPPPIGVVVDVHDNRNGQYRGQKYRPSSRTLSKGLGLKFRYDPPDALSYPYTAYTKVRNHGKEAAAAEQLDREPQTYKISDWQDQRNFQHWESTEYRGLHYLDFEIRKESTTHCATRFGVYIR